MGVPDALSRNKATLGNKAPVVPAVWLMYTLIVALIPACHTAELLGTPAWVLKAWITYCPGG
jgi:hypothetical protein